MALSDRIATKLDALQKQRAEVQARLAGELATIDKSIAVLQRATKVATPDLDALYAELLRAELIREI